MEALQPRAEGQQAKRPPPPDFSKKSFAQMFATEPQQQPLEFPLSVHKGEVAIKISAAAIDKLAVPFKHALVGKFSQGRPTLEETRKTLSKLDFNGALDVGLIDYRHVLLRFHSEADFHRIWTRGIWQIGKYPMRVFKWSPSFQTSKETSIVPVWFELPGLPCHLFDHGVLFSIMKAVGVPISVDAATLNLTRPSVARVNVEIDLMRELPSRIWIEHGDDGEGFWQRIIPGNLPLYCISCFRQGHSHENCTMHEIRKQKNWNPKIHTATTTKLQPTAADASPSTAADAVSKPLLLECNPCNIDIAAGPNVPPQPTIGAGDTVTPPAAADAVSSPLLQELLPCNLDMAAGPNGSSETSLGAGNTMEAERDPASVSGKQKIPMTWNENNLCKSAAHVVLLHPTIGDGNKVENVRDLVDMSGQQKGSTKLEGNLSSTSTTLAAQKLTQLSKMVEDKIMQKGLVSCVVEAGQDPFVDSQIMEETKASQQDIVNTPKNSETTTNSENTTETASKGWLQYDQIGLTSAEVVSKIMANPDVAMACQNPRVQAAIMVCSQNPLSITKYQNDKEVMDVFNKISELFPGVT